MLFGTLIENGDFITKETKIVFERGGRSVACGRWYYDWVLDLWKVPVLQFRYVVGDDRLYVEVAP